VVNGVAEIAKGIKLGPGMDSGVRITCRPVFGTKPTGIGRTEKPPAWA
jgi:hypothetical protein